MIEAMHNLMASPVQNSTASARNCGLMLLVTAQLGDIDAAVAKTTLRGPARRMSDFLRA